MSLVLVLVLIVLQSCEWSGWWVVEGYLLPLCLVTYAYVLLDIFVVLEVDVVVWSLMIVVFWVRPERYRFLYVKRYPGWRGCCCFNNCVRVFEGV
jgi:hypothetical protein